MAANSLIKFSRSKSRAKFFKVFIITSLVWIYFYLFFNIFFFKFYERFGWFRKRTDKLDIFIEQKTNPRFTDNIFKDKPSEGITVPLTYQNDELVNWQPVPINVGEISNDPGELGKPVEIPSTMNLTSEEFKEHYFNVIVSDMISLNRSLADVRPEVCTNINYPVKLPTTSIVIVFHNEAWSTLLRTVWSVINRSPKSLLKEIILVDDASDKDYLGEKLEEYTETLPIKIFIVRAKKRIGIIQGKLLGAKHVNGQVITFLDSHCECTDGWLEPLLSRIAENRQTVVCPSIDSISDITFEYKNSSGMKIGGFNWDLTFDWYRLSPETSAKQLENMSAPLRTPVMAGGLFSIDKQYFYELGSYDEKMKIWGGENIEISLRIWQCGGTLEILPCSHVGHVFRTTTPYTFPGGDDVLLTNLARLAEVWMDKWKDFFYAKNPNAQSGDITKRKALREKLNCKNFSWYLDTVYSKHMFPSDYYYLGDIENAHTRLCLDTEYEQVGSVINATDCNSFGGTQMFAFTKENRIMANDVFCLEVTNVDEPVYISYCKKIDENQKWNYNVEQNTILHHGTNGCLTHVMMQNNSWSSVIKPCGDNFLEQQWILIAIF